MRLSLLAAATLAVASPFAAPLAAQRAGGRSAAPADGRALLRQMHDRYAGKWYRNLTFRQQTTRTLPDGTKRHDVWYEAGQIPGKLRIDVAPIDSMNAIMYVGDSVVVFRRGQRVQAAADRNELMTLGFDVYGQPVDTTIAQLSALGFDLSKLHEASWKGRPAYVVGAAAGDTTSNQFWIDRERLVFVREIKSDATPQGPMRLEITFDEYRPLAGGWVAAEVSINVNGTERQHESYDQIQANAQLAPDLYDTKQYHRPAWIDAAGAGH